MINGMMNDLQSTERYTLNGTLWFPSSNGTDRAILTESFAEGGGAMYMVFKRIGNGEFMQIDSYGGLEQALQQMKGFNVTWPGEYVLRDAEGNDLQHTETTADLNRT
jgi:hypothetical protein